jgi:hypothetical protein
MREVRSAFVKLKPTNNAVIGKIFCHARFRDAEMFPELRLEGIGTTAACATTQKISYGNAQSLTGLDVVIAGKVGIGEDENTRANGSVIGFAKSHRRTGQQAAQLHFEKRQPGRETGVSGTAADARTAGIADRFDGESRYGTAFHGPRRSGLNWFVKYSRRQALRGSSGFRCAGRGDASRALGSFAFTAIAATSTATATAFLIRRTCGFSLGFHGSILGLGFRFSRSCRNFRRYGILFMRGPRHGRGDRWRCQHKIAGGMGWIHRCHLRAKSDRRFLRLRLPIGSAKTVRGGEIPFGGFGILASGFEIARQFKRHHRVARFFVQIGELPDGVLAGAGPTNPGGDLFPVSHVLACIVAAEACYSQRRREVRGKRFLLSRVIRY